MRRNDKVSHMKMANQKYQERLKLEAHREMIESKKETYVIPDIFPALSKMFN